MNPEPVRPARRARGKPDASLRAAAAALACALGLAVAATPAPVTAALHQYTEDFLSTQRCDTVLTTAAWDTVTATLHLHALPLAQLGSYNTSGTAYAAERLGSHLLVADGAANVLLSFDVSDPAAPTPAFSLPLGGMARDVAVTGDWACVSQGSNWKLVTVNVGDPAQPALGSSVNLNGYAGGVAVAGGWAYVAQSNAGVAVVDISDPLAPTLADTVHTGEWARDVALAGSVLLVADSGAGLTLLDVATPAAPAFLGRLDTGGSCYGVTAVGSLAYVADGAGGLLIVDISQPASPTVVSSLPLGAFAQHAAVAGDSVYVAGGAQGLIVVEAADPAQPRVAGQITSNGYAFQAVPGTDAVWLCDGEAGVRSFRIDPDGVDTTRNAAYSRDLHAGAEKIIRAQLSADVDDTVSFALSVNGGGAWTVVTPGEWLTFATPGTDLRWRAVLKPGPGAPPLARRVDVQWETLDDFGAIIAVDDIPDDDGGQVRLRWSRSRHDAPDGEFAVTSYSVYRRFATTGDLAAGKAAAYPPGSWEFLVSVPADQEQEYAVTVPTLADSSAADANWTVLFVRTRTATTGVFFDSPPDSGCSVDNLTPPPPTGLIVDRQAPGGVQLTWDPSPEPDFAHFRIYRALSPWTLPSPATLHAVTGGTAYLDAEPGLWYYQLTVVDTSGRESAPADAPSAVPGTDPSPLRLAPCAPNPANPRTIAAFTVPPGGATVRLAVYDVRGRRLIVLREGFHAGGEHRAVWDGCDDRGRSAPSGRYFLRLDGPAAPLVAPVTLVR